MDTTFNLAALRGGKNRIRIHGHRGARGILPENSLEGFLFTFKIGVRIVELDLLVTADDVPVITHDPHLMPYSTRTQDGNWLENPGPLVARTNYDALQTYDVGCLCPGSDYANRFPEQACLNGLIVPRFSTLCELIARKEFRDIWLNLEIKSDPRNPSYTPPIPKLVDLILKPIYDNHLQERVLLQSFDWRVVHECARQARAIPRSYLSICPQHSPDGNSNIYEGSAWMDGLSLASYGGKLPDAIAAMGGQIWTPYYKDLQREDRERARELGLIVNVWTVNEEDEIARMIALGVDGIITDYPARVQRCLLKHGFHWING